LSPQPKLSGLGIGYTYWCSLKHCTRNTHRAV
jgi:hypothetical protein